MLERIQHPNHIVELRLARPPVNALDPALTHALREALATAATDGSAGIVLSGAPGIFTAGLDVPTLLQLDRPAMRAFWGEFFGVCAALARSPIPVAAAVTGHSPAGGAVFALHCDYRVMAEGDFRIGLNEVRVGLTVPECIQTALRRLVGSHRAERMLVAGAMLDGVAALHAGFVDELAPVGDVIPRTVAWLTALLQLPRAAMLGTRAVARADLAQLYDDPSALPVDAFLDGWYAPATQATLQQLVAKLHKA